MTKTDELVEDTLEFLQHVEGSARAALFSVLRIAQERPTLAVAKRVVEAVLHGTGGAALAAEVSPRARGLLQRLVLRGDHATILYGGGDGADDLEPLAPGDVYRVGLELRQRGLIRDRYSGYGGVLVLPPLAVVELEPAIATAMAPLAGPLRDEPPHAFRLAVATALFAADEPSLTKSGLVHAAAITKLERRLADAAAWARHLPHAAPSLRRLGVLTHATVGDRVVLTLDPDRADEAFTTAPFELSLASLPTVEGAHAHARVFAHLRTVARQQPSGSASMLDLFRAPMPLPRTRSWADDTPEFDGWQVARLVVDLVTFGLAERASADGEPVRVRPTAPPAHHGTGRFVVQPSLEVLVPWDVPPHRVARLAAVADLETADRVCRYRLTRTSVLRGARLLGGGAEVVAFLEEGSGAPVAQNVAATIAGWAGQQRVLRPAHGDVIVADTDELRTLVARAAPQARELARGVFLLPPGGMNAVAKRAKQDGVTVAPTTRGDTDPAQSPRTKRSDPAPATRAAAALRVIQAHEDAVRTLGEPPRGKRSKDTIHRRSEGHGRSESNDDEAGRAAPIPPPRSAPTVPAPPPLPATWTTPLPGALRLQLEAAAALKLPLEVLYVNSKQVPTELLVEPREVRHAAGAAYLEALDVRHRNTCTLALDRITSIRAAPTPR